MVAQGYIPLDDSQSPDALAEKYFSILLRRCFFQDVRKDDDGNIISCKMHDLMQDVAQQVVGKEIYTMKSMNGDVDKKVRHLSLLQSEPTTYLFDKTRVRSYLRFSESYGDAKNADQICVHALVANCKYLRALDLGSSKIMSLPSSIGDLIHLRYLDLSTNEGLEVLPSSFTKLGSLQTLSLRKCRKLKELPKDLSKLVKLRVLNLQYCFQLRYMPRGMGKLTCLHTLNRFILGQTISSKKELFDGLEDLKNMRNLKGALEISIRFTKMVANAYKINNGREGGCLENKEHLNGVVLYFVNKKEEEREEYDEAVMEELQPINSNLKMLVVKGYQGVRMSRWPMEDKLATFLPNLVHMEFYHCLKLQFLGQFRFPRLKKLHVSYCPNLTAILECPALENLTLLHFNERLEISGTSSYDIGPNRRLAIIDNVAWLKSLPMNPFYDVAKLIIETDHKVENLGEARKVFRRCSSTLKYLELDLCCNLKSVVCGGLEHLSALEELQILHCPELSQSEVGGEYSFCQSLRSLKSAGTTAQLDTILDFPPKSCN